MFVFACNICIQSGMRGYICIKCFQWNTGDKFCSHRISNNYDLLFIYYNECLDAACMAKKSIWYIENLGNDFLVTCWILQSLMGDCFIVWLYDLITHHKCKMVFHIWAQNFLKCQLLKPQIRRGNFNQIKVLMFHQVFYIFRIFLARSRYISNLSALFGNYIVTSSFNFCPTYLTICEQLIASSS